jgi:hypothetical protein
MSTRCSCNIWRALWITPDLKWSSGRFGKRVAIDLSEHKSVNSALTQSFEYFKIREVSEEVAISKVAPNYILYLQQFSSVSSYFSHAKKQIWEYLKRKIAVEWGPSVSGRVARCRVLIGQCGQCLPPARRAGIKSLADSLCLKRRLPSDKSNAPLPFSLHQPQLAAPRVLIIATAPHLSILPT